MDTTPTQPLVSHSISETTTGGATSQPSTSSSDSLPKRKQRALRDGEKFMVSTVYKQIYKKLLAEEREDLPDIYDVRVSKNECVLKTSELLGISRTTIFKVLKEEKEFKRFNPPLKPGPKAGFREKYDESTIAAIRRIVDELSRLNDNETPTVAKVLQAVKVNKDLPSMSLSTMRRILKNLNFELKSRPRRSKHSDKRDKDNKPPVSPKCERKGGVTGNVTDRSPFFDRKCKVRVI